MKKVDLMILQGIEHNARISFSELAEQVGLSKTPCWNRVKELEKTGLIKGFHTVFDTEKLGLHIQALINVVVSFNEAEAFENCVMQHANIVNCVAVTGDFDYSLSVILTDINSLDHFLRKELASFAGVERFSTAISTRVIKQKTALSELVTLG